VARRLIVVLAFVAVLFGIVQPALARAGDCCGTGCPTGCSDQTGLASTWTDADGCCATGAAVASLVSIGPRARHAADPASGAPDVAMSPASLHPLHGSSPVPLAISQQRSVIHNNESATYLLTARLRL
jgi:hypothetical protein